MQHPNGNFVKHKSRLCVDGSQQLHGHGYWDTYAPVVSWSNVCLVFLLSSILGLHSRQVDYTQTFLLGNSNLEDAQSEGLTASEQIKERVI
jgi:hypothetical protein